MAPRNSGALVVGYLKEDTRRFVRDVPYKTLQVGGRTIPLMGARVDLRDADLDCSIVGGRCISCNKEVYLNRMGYSAVLEKDADVVCMICEGRYSSEITRSL